MKPAFLLSLREKVLKAKFKAVNREEIIDIQMEDTHTHTHPPTYLPTHPPTHPNPQIG